MVPNRRLKQERELRGWSQAKVAEQIGTDATTVSRWERGVFSPTPYFREKLCNLFSRNAEELGLLETASQPHEHNGFALSSMAVPLPQTNEEWQRESSYTKDPVSLTPPSWSKRADTLTYILHSVAHDQQAYMLWGDAYVQALRGQYEEAQQLGEASLNAFERVGHLNALAIREWLNQQEFTPSTPDVPPTPLPRLSEKHNKQSASRSMRGMGTGIALILMITVALLYAGISFARFGPSVQASSSTAHSVLSTQIVTQGNPLSGFAGNLTPTVSPISTPTPAAPPASMPAPSTAVLAQVTPASLTARDCALESLGYRCDIKLALFVNGSQGTFTWRISGSIVLVHSPLQGSGNVGQTAQITIYIPEGQKGQLIFTFTFASHVSPVFVNWEG